MKLIKDKIIGELGIQVIMTSVRETTLLNQTNCFSLNKPSDKDKIKLDFQGSNSGVDLLSKTWYDLLINFDKVEQFEYYQSTLNAIIQNKHTTNDVIGRLAELTLKLNIEFYHVKMLADLYPGNAEVNTMEYEYRILDKKSIPFENKNFIIFPENKNFVA